MKPSPSPVSVLVSADPDFRSSFRSLLPQILIRGGKEAVVAAEEFFFGRIRNEHTRTAYITAVRRFLGWAEKSGMELRQISPRDVGEYLDGMRKGNISISTRKQHLAAIRQFFDALVMQHVVLLNPALLVRGESHQIARRKTPEIRIDGARKLLASIKTSTVVGLRDRAIIAILVTRPPEPAPLPVYDAQDFTMRGISGCFTSKRRAANRARSLCARTSNRCYPNI